MLDFSTNAVGNSGGFADDGASEILAPGPGVAKPKRWKQVQGSRFGATIVGRDANENILVVGFGVFDENVEVAIFAEDAGVEQFEFRFRAAAALIFVHQPAVRKFGLRILIQILHVAVRWCGIEIEIIFFDVFSVIAFVAGEAKNTFFEDWVAAVPKGERETDHLMAIAEAGDAIFSPAICARTGMIVGKKFPCCPARTVIFADSAPLPLGEVRPPTLPIAISGSVGGRTSRSGNGALSAKITVRAVQHGNFFPT